MDENQMNKIGLDKNRIGRKALDQNPLDEKVLDENWAHDGMSCRTNLTLP